MIVTFEDRKMLDLARNNRKNPTEGEAVMWQMLRRGFCGFHFRRQQPIAEYIADFVCLRRKLVIEIDGGYHLTEEQQQDDAVRTAVLNRLGYTVLRFSNEEVLTETDEVMNKIKRYVIKGQI